MGRNKSSILTQLMDLEKAGGDYHTSYWPQPSFLSSRGVHFEMTMQAYSEVNFVSIFFEQVKLICLLSKKHPVLYDHARLFKSYLYAAKFVIKY